MKTTANSNLLILRKLDGLTMTPMQARDQVIDVMNTNRAIVKLPARQLTSIFTSVASCCNGGHFACLKMHAYIPCCRQAQHCTHQKLAAVLLSHPLTA